MHMHVCIDTYMHTLAHDVKNILMGTSKKLKSIGVMSVKDLIKLYEIIFSSMYYKFNQA